MYMKLHLVIISKVLDVHIIGNNCDSKNHYADSVKKYQSCTQITLMNVCEVSAGWDWGSVPKH